jgi:hypothetical protein
MNDNDRKIKEYKKQKRSKWLLIILCSGVIVLETLALFNVISVFWGLALFVIIYLLKKII